MRFSAILFDLDGTLVDSYPAILQSLNHTREAFGLTPVDLSDVKKLVGRGLENLIRVAIGEEHLEEAIEIFRKSYDETHLTGSLLLPGVKESLAKLKKQRVRLAVASNKPSEYSLNILKNLEIAKFFETCSGPETVGKPKPDPAMLEDLMHRLGSSTADTLYVGDMTLDVETARNAGVRLALVATGGSSYEDLVAASPDYIARDLPSLLPLIA